MSRIVIGIDGEWNFRQRTRMAKDIEVRNQRMYLDW